ncbi:MAG: DUF6067 family protein [Victivallaceae bacterium]|nr:DUF6067 family protein [Victivallaceae bacterium]
MFKKMFSLLLILIALSFMESQAGSINKTLTRDGFAFPLADKFANSSFETYNAAGSFPLGFRVTKTKIDKVTVVNDYRKAFHGNVFLLVNSPVEEIVTLGTDPIKTGQKSGSMTLSIWTRGQGTFQFGVYSYDQSRVMKGQRSPKFKVNSSKWRKLSWSVILPEKVKSKLGERPVVKVTILFYASGKVALDKVSMMSKANQAVIDKNFYLASTSRRTPFIAIPKFKKAPVIDGVIKPAEWGAAAKITGFTNLRSKTFSKRQSDVYLGYDDKNLYVAFSSVRGRHARRKAKLAGVFGEQIDAFELWLRPSDKVWSQILITPFNEVITSGLKLDKSQFEYKALTVDSGETVGGVLTFEKTLFYVELKIPFTALKIAPPRAGDSWKVNFCSDFAVDKGIGRKSSDWTTWAQVDGFKRFDQFGEILFSGRSEAVQFDTVGELNNANINLTGRVNNRNNSAVNVLTWVGLSGSDKKLMSNYQLLSGKTDRKFVTTANLDLKQLEKLVLYAQVNDIKRRKVLAAVAIPFAPKPSFNIELIPDYAKGDLYISLDVAKLAFLPEIYKVKVEVSDKKSNRLFYRTAVEKNKNELSPVIKLKLTAINNQQPGDYIVRCFIVKPNSETVLGTTLEYLEIPDLKQFAWLNNNWGKSDKVLAPWTPVKVKGDTVYVTERKYSLANSGLPTQITVLNSPLFSRKPAITAIVNGRKTAMVFDKLKQLDKQDTEVTWRIAGSCGPLKINGTVKVEFDGFALWTIKISSTEKAVINQLYLTFPFKKAQSLYARGADFTSGYTSKYYSALYDYRPELKIFSIAHTPISLYGGWPWIDKLFNNIWIGDDERGLGIMTESDEFMFGGKFYEINQASDPEANILKYNFISEDVVIDKNSLHYEIAYQATPVKPRPVDPKLWHNANIQVDRDKIGFQKRVSMSLIAYWALHPLCYPEVYDKSFLQLKAKYGKYGVKALPYSGMNFVGVEVPEWKYFKGVWASRPQRGWSYPRGKSDYVSSKSSFIDYFVWMAKEVVDKLKFDGIYLDVSQPSKSTSQFHGAGYERNGKRYPTVNIFALRELFKRIYYVYNTGGRNAVMYVHQTGIPATAGFAAATTEGEGWLREQKRGYSRLTPKFFRLRDMRIQYGTPYTWYTSFNYAYRTKRQYGFVIPTEEILAYSLPHYVMPAIADASIWPVWDTLDFWWTDSTFIPYWQRDKIITSDKPDVYGSLLVKKVQRKAIIMGGNWSDKPQQVTFTINAGKLFGENGVLEAKLLSGNGTKLSVNNNRVSCTIAGKNYVIIEINLNTK